MRKKLCAAIRAPEWVTADIIFRPPDVIQVKDLPPKWGLLWATRSNVTVQREARGCPERNLLAEVRFLSAMLRRAQIRIGSRPLSEWLRGENRFEARRGVPPEPPSRACKDARGERLTALGCAALESALHSG